MIRPGIKPWSKSDEIRLGPDEGVRFFRGLIFAMLFSVPMWAGIIWLIIWLNG